ncbi:hypothetical protein [Phaffia rhodozyma]|uniref:Transmembrane protein n=1 Tax=Phaffia rhodozyma TaxID=264483 RepID=A0A0F7SHA1_PHARH|nr:hypothetical protein [Phaffia rhodozyma]
MGRIGYGHKSGSPVIQRGYALIPQADLSTPIGSATPLIPGASASSPAPASTVVTPKKRGILYRLIRGTIILNTTLFVVGLVGAGGLWVYYGYIAPGLTIYRRTKEGVVYAVGAYDRGKGWYSWGREKYGYFFRGESEDGSVGSESDPVVGTKRG